MHKLKGLARAVMVLVLVAFGVRGVWAQEEVELEKIVVTPYRYPEILEKTSSSISVIGQNEIKKSNAQKVTDVLRTVPGLNVRDLYGNGARATVDIAGFGEHAGLNVLVLVDGRRVNDADLSGVDWTQIPLEQVERIEVMRGGLGGVLYGDNASSGVINIITRKGTGEPKVNLQVGYGSYDANKQRLSIEGGVKEKFSYLFSGTHQATHGYRENTFNKEKDFASKLECNFNEALSMHFSSGFHESAFGLPGALFQHHIDEQGRRWARYGEDYVDNRDFYFLLGPRMDFSGFGNFDVDFSYRQKETDSYFLTSQNPARKNKMETFGWTPKYILAHSLFGRNNKLIAGMDYYRVLYDSNQYLYNDDSILREVTGITKTSLGAYFQDELSLLSQLVCVAGYRYEGARYTFGYHDFSTDPGHPYPDQNKKVKFRMRAFNSGIVYNYQDNGSAFFNASKSFRFPEVDEFIFQDQNFQQQLNTDLKPQSAVNYQVGLRHMFGKQLRAGISLFRMNVKNELYYNPNGGPWGFGQNENYGKTVHEGAESSLDVKLNDWANLFLNYSLTKAYFKDGIYDKNKVPMVPRHKGSVGLRLYLPRNFTFNMTGIYVGKRYFINDTPNAFSELNGYMVADMNISWNCKDLTLTFGINNVFDKEYSEFGVYGFDSSTFLMDKAYYPSPGRNFSLKLEYRF
ncbi:MAG: TonB-dependent receptor [Candidatus Omnitrophota bacterium]